MKADCQGGKLQSVLRVTPNRFRITVSDEGSGFDYSMLDFSGSENPYQERRRGYFSIKTLADTIRFNPSGNMVIVDVLLPLDVTFEIRTDGDWLVVVPSGNMTSLVAETFRTLQMEHFDRKTKKYRFDFRYVEDVDSLAMSVFFSFAKMLMKISGSPRAEIVNLNKGVFGLFRMMGLDQLYAVSLWPVSAAPEQDAVQGSGRL